MDLFVYGTLRSAALAESVAGREPQSEPATLAGFEVWRVAGAITPLIRASESGVATGQLWRDVGKAALARLDLYEGAFGYRLAPVTVTLADGSKVAAQTYMPPEDLEPGDGPWSFEEWRAYERFSVLAAREVFHHDPPYDAHSLKRAWPQIQKRAWSAARAEASAPKQTRTRRMAAPGDLTFRDRPPLHGSFFGLQRFTVDYTQFGGGRSDRLDREVFVGVEAVMVLPYDPVRDRLLLVEQVRMGPGLRGDPNPWCLEPVAGMMDALETPEETGRRETKEEAGLDLREMRHLTSFYPSPGSSTDHFHAYLGLCDLPETDSYTGGLDTEAEDLRLHVLSFEAAMGLVKTGEINVGPLVMMLYWLKDERAALRASA